MRARYGLSRRRLMRGAGLAGLGLLVGCGRLPWQTQRTIKNRTVGYLSTRSPDADDAYLQAAFRQGLGELGYVEGQNILIERRAAENRDWARLAAELVALPVDVLVGSGTVGALAAKQATSSIPIVFFSVGDPVGLGLVDSLARPGGNLTGVSSLNVMLGEKRLELLKAVAPRASKIACFYDPADPASAASLDLMLYAAQTLNVTLDPIAIHGADDFDRAFAAASQTSSDALLTSGGPFLGSHAERIVDFAARTNLPAMYNLRRFVATGGLMSYAASQEAQSRRAAYFVDRILKGARPADLPIEQPTTFEFIINLKTARGLDLTIPQHVLLQATEVIQ